MIGAAATVILHGEHTHAIAPLVVLTISLVVAWFNKPKVILGIATKLVE